MKLPTTTLAWTHTGVTGRDAKLADLLRLEEKKLPKLGLGMALIQVEGSPVNPSDVMYIRGLYGMQPKVGEVPGFEGCGTVLAANAGPYGWWLKGRRVSFGSQEGHGAWTQFAVVPVFSAIPIRKDLPVPCAATLIVNPMTAIGLIARAKRHKTGAVVVNAAGSTLGRYLLALAKYEGLRFIGIVRREESVNELLQMGADHVLVASDDDFMDRFASTCRDLDARVLMDAVAGEQTAQLIHAMPDRTLAIVYGTLSEEQTESQPKVVRATFDADGLVFRRQQVEGYWLTHELHGFNGVFTPLIRARMISKMYKKGLFSLGGFKPTALEDLLVSMQRAESNGGKVLFLRDEPRLHPIKPQGAAPLEGQRSDSDSTVLEQR